MCPWVDFPPSQKWKSKKIFTGVWFCVIFRKTDYVTSRLQGNNAKGYFESLYFAFSQKQGKFPRISERGAASTHSERGTFSLDVYMIVRLCPTNIFQNEFKLFIVHRNIAILVFGCIFVSNQKEKMNGPSHVFVESLHHHVSFFVYLYALRILSKLDKIHFPQKRVKFEKKGEKFPPFEKAKGETFPPSQNQKKKKKVPITAFCRLMEIHYSIVHRAGE